MEQISFCQFIKLEGFRGSFNLMSEHGKFYSNKPTQEMVGYDIPGTD